MYALQGYLAGVPYCHGYSFRIASLTIVSLYLNACRAFVEAAYGVFVGCEERQSSDTIEIGTRQVAVPSSVNVVEQLLISSDITDFDRWSQAVEGDAMSTVMF